MTSIGSHCIVELYGCPAELLNNVDRIRTAIREAADRARATLLGEVCHAFTPQGVTAIAILSESHISIHTWPEKGYAAADVFTCGSHTEPERACRHLARALEASRHELRVFRRGSVPDQRPALVFSASSDGRRKTRSIEDPPCPVQQADRASG